MKIIKLMFLVSIATMLGCSGNNTADDPSDECIRLQEELNEATDLKLTTLNAYVKDTDNALLCTNYADALRDRIDKAQAMIDANCLSLGALQMTEQAIEEDKAEILNLGC